MLLLSTYIHIQSYSRLWKQKKIVNKSFCCIFCFCNKNLAFDETCLILLYWICCVWQGQDTAIQSSMKHYGFFWWTAAFPNQRLILIPVTSIKVIIRRVILHIFYLPMSVFRFQNENILMCCWGVLSVCWSDMFDTVMKINVTQGKFITWNK